MTDRPDLDLTGIMLDVAIELALDPEISATRLLEIMRKLHPDEVEGLTLRQFSARYPLQVKRSVPWHRLRGPHLGHVVADLYAAARRSGILGPGERMAMDELIPALGDEARNLLIQALDSDNARERQRAMDLLPLL